MKSFHYNQDPLYDAAVSILQGQSSQQEQIITEEKIVKIVATAGYGAIRKGETFMTTVKTNSMGQTRLVIRDEDIPQATLHPTLFFNKDGAPDGTGGWKHFEIVAEDNMSEAPKFNMGTATITRPGHTLDGKKVYIFHKFDDGRVNAQYVKSDRKGDILNLTLKQDEYKLDESDQALTEQTFSKDTLKAILNTMETRRFEIWYNKDFTDYNDGDPDSKTQEEILDDLKNLFEKGYI
jgi:hypothetical protein